MDQVQIAPHGQFWTPDQQDRIGCSHMRDPGVFLGGETWEPGLGKRGRLAISHAKGWGEEALGRPKKNHQNGGRFIN